MGDEAVVDGVALEQQLGHAGQQRHVAADVRLDVQAGDLRAEEQAPDVGGNAEIDQADFLDRVDDDDLAAVPADVHQRPHQPRVVGGRVAADEEKQVGVFDVFERDGGRAGAQRFAQADAAGLVAVEGAVVDVVGAVEPGEELKQEAGFVGGSAAGVEEILVGLDRLELVGEAAQGLIPVDGTIVRVAGAGVQRLREPAAPLQLAGRQVMQLGDAVALERTRA